MDLVANEMFSDGQINWGRVVTLISFCRILLASIDNSYKEETITYISEWFSKFIMTQTEWLELNDWWVSNPEEHLRGTLLRFTSGYLSLIIVVYLTSILLHRRGLSKKHQEKMSQGWNILMNFPAWFSCPPHSSV